MFTENTDTMVAKTDAEWVASVADKIIKEREEIHDLETQCLKLIQGDVFTKLYDQWGKMTARLLPVEVPARGWRPELVPVRDIDAIPQFMLRQIDEMRLRLMYICTGEDAESQDAYAEFIETAEQFTKTSRKEFMLIHNIRELIMTESRAGEERMAAIRARIMSPDFTVEQMREMVKRDDEAFKARIEQHEESRKKWEEHFVANGLGSVLNHLDDFLRSMVGMRVEPIWIRAARRITEDGEKDPHDCFMYKTVHGEENPLYDALPINPLIRFVRDGEDQEGMRIMYRPAKILPQEEKDEMSVDINPEGTGVRVTIPARDEPDAAIYSANIEVKLNDGMWAKVGIFSLHLYQEYYTMRLEGQHRIFYHKIENPYLFADAKMFARNMAYEYGDVIFPEKMEE